MFKKILPYFLAISLLVGTAVISGCSTFQNAAYVAPAARGVSANAVIGYKRQENRIEANVIVAALGYTSSHAASRSFGSWGDYKAMFDKRIKGMSGSKGMVATNYPVKPNKYEVAWYKAFTYSWMQYAKRRYASPREARDSLLYVISDTIVRIQDYEYGKRRR